MISGEKSKQAPSPEQSLTPLGRGLRKLEALMLEDIKKALPEGFAAKLDAFTLEDMIRAMRPYTRRISAVKNRRLG